MKLIVFLCLLVSSQAVLADTKYNPHTNKYETTTANSELKYNPHSNEWKYAPPNSQPKYNPTPTHMI
jgi:hypothetical protein